MAATKIAHRIESDFLGQREISNELYYGIYTARALDNFSVSGVSVAHFPQFIKAFAAIKQAAAMANRELGLLDDRIAGAIARGCKSIWSGYYHEQFVVDVLQGGAGASTNMNANEVIANLALEFLGAEKGHYKQVHPLEHVNLNQSTFDVYPAAIKLALCFFLEDLLSAMQRLRDAFSEKAIAFTDSIKMGRTQLQDAVPMTLGDEFRSYADSMKDGCAKIEHLRTQLLELNLGDPGVGADIKSYPDYANRVCRHIANITRQPISEARRAANAADDVAVFVEVSGVVKRVAIHLSKICNDLRLLASGPKTGLNEIRFPPVQAAPSVMPDSIQPVIAEMVNQVAFDIVGNDTTVSVAAESGQLQSNAFEPVIAYSVFKSVKQLTLAITKLDEHCVRGIEANTHHLRHQVEDSIGIVAVLTPYIGYRDATELATKALASNAKISDLAIEMKLLSKDQLDQILKPEALMKSLSARLI